MIPLRDSITSRRWPVVNFLIILVNAWVFYKQVELRDARALEAFIMTWGLVPERFFQGPLDQWENVFSAMFMHGGFLHFFGNMLYLYIFGDNVEDRMGHFKYLVFYILCGTLASAAQVFMFPSSTVPMIGASGAIAGVLGAYFVLYPHAKVLTLIPIWIFIRIVPIPAFFLLGFWFVMQALSGTMSLGMAGHVGGGIAWWAHAGGFFTGALLVFLFRERQ